MSFIGELAIGDGIDLLDENDVCTNDCIFSFWSLITL